jgi:TonB family protein
MRFRSAAAVLVLLTTAEFRPARLIRSDAPHPAPQTAGWETAMLRARVSERGVVDAIEVLGGTEPLTSGLRRTVGQWRFEPAMDGVKPAASHVLVASVYRPATLHDAPAFGGITAGLAAEPDQIPVPTSTAAPRFPPNALGDGVVIVVVLVGVDGDVRSAAVVRSTASGFNDSAMKAASAWRFRPAARQGRPALAYAYLVFGFRQPVIGKVEACGDEET